MRVLVVGGGGREHALAWGLARSPSVQLVAAAPGNPGIEALGRCYPVRAEDVGGVVALAERERFDLVVVGPEAPLAAGLADALAARGVLAFGCSARAAEIESSKRFAKDLMTRAGLPTARYGSFTSDGAADAFLDGQPRDQRLVVKASGLAAGKGVVLCDDVADARRVAHELLGGALGEAGRELVIEELLVGREASCMALVDGERFWLLDACEDHKSIFDGDRGPMTGGMGAICPTPVIDAAGLERVGREVFAPIVQTLCREGRPFRGLLYAGLMLTADGPKVLEFNCRFGDPETQPLLARFHGDLGEALQAVAAGREPPAPRFSDEAACCVVLAARGYPGPPEKGAPIAGLAAAAAVPGVTVLHAGTRRVGDEVVVAGGRVLGVTAVGVDLEEARRRAYLAVAEISFDGAQHRRDIGARRE